MKALKILIFMLMAFYAVKSDGAGNSIIRASAQAGILPLVEGKDDQSGKYHLFFRLYITNISKRKIAVPTSGFRRGAVGDKNYYISILTWDFYHTREGSMIIPSASSIGIVELLPGESALISWEDDVYRKGRLEKISVKLDMDTSFRSRFNLALSTLTIENIKTGFIRDVEVVTDGAPQGLDKKDTSQEGSWQGIGERKTKE
jgi:hypothetical protein